MTPENLTLRHPATCTVCGATKFIAYRKQVDGTVVLVSALCDCGGEFHLTAQGAIELANREAGAYLTAAADRDSFKRIAEKATAESALASRSKNIAEYCQFGAEDALGAVLEYLGKEIQDAERKGKKSLLNALRPAAKRARKARRQYDEYTKRIEKMQTRLEACKGETERRTELERIFEETSAWVDELDRKERAEAAVSKATAQATPKPQPMMRA